MLFRATRIYRHLLLLCSLLIVSSSALATDFSKVYAKVKDSVVTIKTNKYVEKETEEGVVSSQLGGIGSGVILDKDGLILTAAHVVHIADRIEVNTNDGKTHHATVISSIPFADLALVKMTEPPKNLPTVKTGDSDKMRIGQEVFVVGAPYGLSQTLTVGHFSGRRHSDNENGLIDTEFLQTDAPINKGNSGGPMFNTKGEVIGIVSHIRSSSGGSEGLGFAASINMARDLFLDHEHVWAGMELVPMSPMMARAINAPYPDAILVQQVAYGSLADKLGIQPGRIPAIINGRKMLLGGDVIIAFGDHPIKLSKESLVTAREYMGGVAVGEPIEMTVFRDGEQIKLSIIKE
ncbi:trypsin-like peptidase domain-containing protein [Maricurvus nonylphenolicus]|uniref:S1C family serine protease n=1 Tax=Maricurvus nonylphenolicus TaxID=1008307 RepID=UPI0036F2746F